MAGYAFTYDDRANMLHADPYFGNAHAFGGHYCYDGDRLTAHVSDVMHLIGGIAYADTLATFSHDDRARMTRDSWDDTRSPSSCPATG